LGGGAPDVHVGTGDEKLIGTADEVVQWNEETFDNNAGQGKQNSNTKGGVIGNEFWEFFEDDINWGGDDFDHDDVEVISSVITDEKADEKGDNVIVGTAIDEVRNANKLRDHKDDDRHGEREEVAEDLASLDMKWQQIDDTLAVNGLYFV
jgi:hypothetical protein